MEIISQRRCWHKSDHLTSSRLLTEAVRDGKCEGKGRQIGRPQVGKVDITATFLRHYPAYKSKQLNVSELARVCDIVEPPHTNTLDFWKHKRQGAVIGSLFHCRNINAYRNRKYQPIPKQRKVSPDYAKNRSDTQAYPTRPIPYQTARQGYPLTRCKATV